MIAGCEPQAVLDISVGFVKSGKMLPFRGHMEGTKIENQKGSNFILKLRQSLI